jgi:hypothetical protein
MLWWEIRRFGERGICGSDGPSTTLPWLEWRWHDVVRMTKREDVNQLLVARTAMTKATATRHGLGMRSPTTSHSEAGLAGQEIPPSNGAAVSEEGT